VNRPHAVGSRRSPSDGPPSSRRRLPQIPRYRQYGCLLLLFLCLLIVSSHGDETTPAPITDQGQLSTHYRQVLERPEFQDHGESDVDNRFKDLISQWFMRLGAKLGQFKYAAEMPRFSSLLMTLMALFALAALGYIMLRLVRRRGEGETIRAPRMPGQKTFLPPESYDDEIRQATEARNWHAAWMASWRQFLSRLENRQLVETDRTRTNREYLAQLHALSPPSSALTLLNGMVDAYDRYIYGHKPIGEPDWNLFHHQAQEAALLLHLDDQRPGASPQPSAP